MKQNGFSFVEVLLALAMFAAVAGAFLQVAASGQRLARSQSEATDLHQRVRVAVARLSCGHRACRYRTAQGRLLREFECVLRARCAGANRRPQR